MRILGLLCGAALVLFPACATVPPSQPVKGDTINLHRYTIGTIDNQSPIGNGAITYRYGELCEFDSRYSHRVTVLGKSGNELLLRYETDHPSPGDRNRNCINGVLFVVTLDLYDEMLSRFESFKAEKKKENQGGKEQPSDKEK